MISTVDVWRKYVQTCHITAAYKYTAIKMQAHWIGVLNSMFSKRGGMIHNWFSHPLVNEARLRVIIYFLIFDSQECFVVMYQYKWNLKYNVNHSEGLPICMSLHVWTCQKPTHFLFFVCPPHSLRGCWTGSCPICQRWAAQGTRCQNTSPLPF